MYLFFMKLFLQAIFNITSCYVTNIPAPRSYDAINCELNSRHFLLFIYQVSI